jgi:membrane peptidoglycan carboxypeptidase
MTDDQDRHGGDAWRRPGDDHPRDAGPHRDNGPRRRGGPEEAGSPGGRRPAPRGRPTPAAGGGRSDASRFDADEWDEVFDDRPDPEPRTTGTARVPVPGGRRNAGPPESPTSPSVVGRAQVRPRHNQPGQDMLGPAGMGPDDGTASVPTSGSGGRHSRVRPWLGRQRRRNIILASFAVFIMLTGIGVVAGSYYVDGIKTPDQLTFPESTTVYYSDGKTVLAKLGEVTRYNLTYDQMNDAVKEAIVASEDKTFWTNSGVDFASVIRAAWNNFTGGQTQGGSTITQQYARLAFDLQGATFSRKIREAILAWKLDGTLPKQKILEYYLNAVPFGRNTYGIEAASQAFFGKTANRNAPAPQQITKADAMVLVSMVKQPEPDPKDPKGHPGYDPTYNALALKQAQDRFAYVRQQMKDLGYLTPTEDATLKFPLTEVKPNDPTQNVGFGMDKPAGLVVNHVLDELSHSPGAFNGMPWQDIRDGGYKIITTINFGAQQAAEKAADGANRGSFMSGQPSQLQAALVGIQPGTGRVLAYYGGHDGKAGDYAGVYFDEQGQGNGFGRQPAGSSFKVYTLATALNSGISLNSYWDSAPHDLPGRTGSNRVVNSGDCPTGANQPCSLLNSTIASLNIPFYEVTMSVGAQKVLEMARAAGIDNMWNDARVRQPLVGADLSKLVPSQFDTVLGIGQYPITVLDHANGVATFAAGGLRANAHFVAQVMDNDKIVYSEKLPSGNEPRILSPEAENDLTYALSKVSASTLSNGWDSAGKTGTWELGTDKTQNADAWMTGFTRRLAAAVWVGNKGAEKALLDRNGSPIYGAGIPASIWRSFITNATEAMNISKSGTDFAPPSFAGSTNPPGSVPGPQSDQQQPGKPACRFIIFFCPPGRGG